MMFDSRTIEMRSSFVDSPETDVHLSPHDVIPPFISTGTTPEFLREQIESMRSFAEASTDLEISSQLVSEIGYLTNVLAKFNQ